MKYRTIREWINAESIPTPIGEIADPHLRDKHMAQFVVLRNHLFAQHLSTLSSEEQLQYQNGVHPSLSWRFKDRAEVYAQMFDAYLRQFGFTVQKVDITYWHGDELFLTARL